MPAPRHRRHPGSSPGAEDPLIASAFEVGAPGGTAGADSAEKAEFLASLVDMFLPKPRPPTEFEETPQRTHLVEEIAPAKGSGFTLGPVMEPSSVPLA